MKMNTKQSDMEEGKIRVAHINDNNNIAVEKNPFHPAVRVFAPYDWKVSDKEQTFGTVLSLSPSVFTFFGASGGLGIYGNQPSSGIFCPARSGYHSSTMCNSRYQTFQNARSTTIQSTSIELILGSTRRLDSGRHGRILTK